MKQGYLLKDRKERGNLKRWWYVNAWRIVDVNENDLFQPRCDTKAEALKVAKALNITVIGELPGR
jgi:hypothetical protein